MSRQKVQESGKKGSLEQVETQEMFCGKYPKNKGAGVWIRRKMTGKTGDAVVNMWLTARIFWDILSMMIPGSKGHKIRCKLACRRIFELGTRQNMSKKPFFKEKRADCECFADCGAIQYYQGRKVI